LSRPGNSLGSPREVCVTMGKLKSKEWWSRGRLVGLDIVEREGVGGLVVVAIGVRLKGWLSENSGSGGDGGSDGREIGG